MDTETGSKGTSYPPDFGVVAAGRSVFAALACRLYMLTSACAFRANDAKVLHT